MGRKASNHPAGKKAWNWGLAAVVVVGLGVALWWQLRPETNVAEESEPAPEARVDLGAYYDWNQAPNATARTLRPHVSEPLIEMRKGRPVYRLAKDAAWEDGLGRLELRNLAYWSDKVALSAEQVVAAFERLRESAKKGAWKPQTPRQRQWLAHVTLTIKDGNALEIQGLREEDEFYEFASSPLVRPIRSDLLDSEDPKSAWLVSIGKYRLDSIQEKPVLPGHEIQLQPNPHYYRRPAEEPRTIELPQSVRPESKPGS